jgi:CO dehydrogenase maturation factor
MEKPIIALCGKGGVGKTSTSALIAGSLIRMKDKGILLIDADPVQGLTRAIGEEAKKTVADVREKIIAQSKDKSQRRMIATSIDYWMLEAMEERHGYSVLAMGATDEAGCFCPLNSLVKGAIKELAQNFDAILIDGEAGIEQINREVMQGANILLMLTDPSMRGFNTASMILEKIEQGRLKPDRVELIVNRSKDDEEIRKTAKEVTGLDPVSIIPEDPLIKEFDMQGKSLLELPEECESLKKVKSMLEKLLM